MQKHAQSCNFSIPYFHVKRTACRRLLEGLRVLNIHLWAKLLMFQTPQPLSLQLDWIRAGHNNDVPTFSLALL